jgi:hypothetical protein
MKEAGSMAAPLRTRLEQVLGDIRRHGLIEWKGRTCLTGYSYHEFYDWDLYFENLFLSYVGVSEYARNGVEMFLDQQLECGFVSRTVLEPRWRQHFKPFLAQTALLAGRQSGDFHWLEGNYYERLKKYLDHWFWFCDFDRNGLAVWDSADHSGMDNQVRRAGEMHQSTVEGVDLNCYLVRDLEAMASLADELGKADEADGFRSQAQRLAKRIDETFWDEKDGFYYDRDERTGKPVRVKTVAGFTPLWLGLVPPDRAGRLIREHILNPDEFWLHYPVATWAKTEPNYYQDRVAGECNWRGTVWIPTNYMVFHGLLRYGYREAAKELADRTFRMVMEQPRTREYYNGETGGGQGLDPFWGWSSLAYLMPLEYEEGYDPSDLHLRSFRPLLRDRFGLTL